MLYVHTYKCMCGCMYVCMYVLVDEEGREVKGREGERTFL